MKLRVLKVSMLCVAIGYVLGESETLRYRIVANKRFLKTFKNETEVTEISCCRLCSVTVGCDIVNYKTTERTCELGEFEAGDDPHMVSATGWSMIYETGDDCASNPCMNSGVCTDGIGHYTCACASGYFGTNCEEGCTGDWVVFGNSCYYIQRIKNIWEDAETSCVTNGSHLVAINSEAENIFIGDLLDSNNIQNGWVWIGGRNLSSGFHWSNGEAIEDGYENWDVDLNQPDTPNFDQCMLIPNNSPYKWHDALCTHWFISICEFEL